MDSLLVESTVPIKGGSRRPAVAERVRNGLPALACRVLAVTWLACGAVVWAATAPAPVLDVDFSGDIAGEPPSAAAAVTHGPGRRVMVVDAGTLPSDPFGGENNQSLMFETLERTHSSHCAFRLPAPLLQGALELDFYLLHTEDADDDEMLRSPHLQLFLGGPEGVFLFLAARGGRSLTAGPSGDAQSMDGTVPVNRRNRLQLTFDTVAGVFTGMLNGVPLTSGGGRQETFQLPTASGGIHTLSMRPGSSSVTGSRVFIDRMRIGPASEIEFRPVSGENLLPNAAFEAGQTPGEIYPIIGEYRHRDHAAWSWDATERVHGARSLRIEGTQPFIWEVLHRESHAHVFSVYLKSAVAGAEVEIGVEKLGFSNEGGVRSEGRTIRNVSVGPEWQRFDAGADWSGTQQRGLISSHLYRTWVRPLAAGTLWMDGAQLERHRDTPGPFSAARGDNALTAGLLRLRHTRFIDGEPEDWRDPNGVSRRGEITLRVRETAGVARHAEPVRAGVPFPRGTLHDPAAVRLRSADGMEIPVQTRALAWWPRGGGVRSLLLDFQVTAAPGEQPEFTLEYGAVPATPNGPDLAREENGRIILDTGALTAVLGPERGSFFERLESADGRVLEPPPGTGGSYAVGLDGQLFRSAVGALREFVIEENGPLRAVVWIQGEHLATDGQETLLDYELRIHAFAGKEYLLIEHTFENREPYWNQPIRAQALELPIPWDGGPGTVTYGLLGPDTPGGGLDRPQEVSAPLPAGGLFALTQVKDYYGEGHYTALVESGPAGAPAQALEGMRLAGWLAADGALLAVEDFWRMHPKRITVAPGALRFYHWPDRHVVSADLPFGMSNGLRLLYAPFGGGVQTSMPVFPGGGQAASPVIADRAGSTLGLASLLPQPDPGWVAAAGVFGHYLTAAETAAHYPRYERILREFFEMLAVERAALDMTGMWDYGDMGSPGRWANNEHTVARNLWLEYLRTGDPALHERARILTRHLRDVDILYAGPGSRHLHHHAGGIHTMQSFHMGHYWVTGLVWHYLLTGDMRSFHVARDVGAGLMTKYRNNYTGRNRARLLFHAAELYELTRLPVFRTAFEVQYAFGQPTGTSNYHGGKGLLTLLKWYDITGDEAFLQRAVADGERVLEARASLPPAVGSGRDWTIFEALGELARRTGDRRFVEGYHRHLPWFVLNQDTSEHNMVRGAGFLEAASRFGLDEHPDLPARLFDFRLMTGQTQHYLLRLLEVRAPMVGIEIHRMEGPPVAVTIERPDGTVLRQLASARENPPERLYAELSPEDAVDGEILVRLQGGPGSRFAFSTEHEPVFLHAEQSFRTRRGRADTAFYRYVLQVAQDADHVTLQATHWPGGAALPGRAVAVWLQDEQGRMIARRRWLTPLTPARLAPGGKSAELPAAFHLPVPREYRGQPLTLTVFAPLGRYFGWRIDGLETPWIRRPVTDGMTVPPEAPSLQMGRL